MLVLAQQTAFGETASADAAAKEPDGLLSSSPSSSTPPSSSSLPRGLNALNDISRMLHGVEGAAASREMSVKSAAEVTARHANKLARVD